MLWGDARHFSPQALPSRTGLNSKLIRPTVALVWIIEIEFVSRDITPNLSGVSSSHSQPRPGLSIKSGAANGLADTNHRLALRNFPINPLDLPIARIVDRPVLFEIGRAS